MPGSFAFVLHSHIPYVLSHGRWPHGTSWLHEVAASSYVPLLDALYDLVEEGYSPRITIGITPVLAEQLADTSFKYEFQAYLREQIKAAANDKRTFARLNNESCARQADFWHELYSGIMDRFKKRYQKSLIGAFAALQDAGHIEIITSSATHGYSPLLSQDASIQAQVRQGVATYRKHFGRAPQGYWLPECAYRPGYRWSPPVQPKGRTIDPCDRRGVEEFLAESGLKFFLAESHLLHGGETRGVYIDRFGALEDTWKEYAVTTDFPAGKTPYAAYLVESAHADASAAPPTAVGARLVPPEDAVGDPPGGTRRAPTAVGSDADASSPPIAVFFRDDATGQQVWSRATGYPGDEWYLEFHKKHTPGGLKYWRVTGPNADLGDKECYDPEKADERIRAHAEHFVQLSGDILDAYAEVKGTPGVICAPYDSELFGHWWFEGTRWLYHVLKGMADSPDVQLVTCSEYLEANPPTASIALPEGSWGEGGFHYMWLNQETEWTWPCVYDAELEMQDLVAKFGDNPEVLPILKQAARELLLLQSSDWQFSISTRASKDYGESRLTDHYKSFQKLASLIRKKASGVPIDQKDWDAYKVLEERDCLFADVDPQWWAKPM